MINVQSSILRRLTVAAIVAACVPMLWLVDIELRRQQIAGQQASSREGYHLPPPSVLRALSFGYNEFAADLLWIRTIAYYTDHLFSDHDLQFLNRHLQNILTLDDHFKQVYRYGSSMMMSQGQRQTNETVMTAIALLKQAHRIYPDDWKFPLHIGSYYMGELRTRNKKLRARWMLQGADWVRRAAIVGAEISWLPSLAARIYTKHGQRRLAIRHLQELYLTTQDPRMKQQIAAQLRELKEAKLAAEIKEAARSMNESHRTSKVSFVPRDLFVLLRLPRPGPFSLSEIAEIRGEPTPPPKPVRGGGDAASGPDAGAKGP